MNIFKGTHRLLIVSALALYFIVPFHVHAFTISSPQTNNLGLMAYWTFDGKDIQNGVVIDKSGQGMNANITNAASSTMFVQGKIGQAILFNGSNQYLTTGGVAMPATVTMSAWVKTSGNGYAVIDHGNDLSLASVFHKLAFSPNSCYSCGAVGSTNIDDGAWHFVVGVVTGNTFYAYFDGALESTFATTYTGSGVAAFSIGRNALNGGDFFPGIIDDVRVYSRALSGTEIAELYNNTKGKITTPAPNFLNASLIGWWTFDGKDIQNGVLLDKSGQGNNANIINAATSTFLVAGVLGQAGNFDGVDDAVRMTSNPTSNYASPQTTCAWFKTPVTNVQQTLVSTLTDTNNNSMLSLSSTGIIAYSHKAAGTTYGGYKPGQYLANTWTLGCGVFDGTTVKIYANTVDAGTLLPLHVNAAVNGIGKGTYNFKGLIDDVRVYNRALSAAEINTLYSVTQNKYGTSPAAVTTGGDIKGWWTFDGKNIVNGVIKDISGQGNNGNVIGIASSTFYSIGKLGQGVSFDGVNDQITFTDSPFNFGTNSFSVSFWIKPDTSIATGQSVVAKIDSALSQGWKISQIGNVMNFFVRSSGTDFTSVASPTISNKTWTHVLAVVNRTAGTILLYANGVAGSSSSISGFATFDTTGIPLQMSGYRSDSDLIYKGSLDDVRIYNRALSATEAQKLYKSGK